MLGNRLKKLREEKKLTQEQLGQLVDLSQQTIGHYEVNRAKPDLETIQRFAEIFNVTTDFLLGRTKNRNESLPTDTELENFLQKSNIKFDGAPLDNDDKEDIINFLRMV